jgi:hypothetical protein
MGPTLPRGSRSIWPYPGRVFGRGKSSSQVEAPVSDGPAKLGGKGRPTPKRREVEQANRKPIVAGARQTGPVGSGGAKLGGTKEEQKAAKAARRQADRAERAKARVGLLNGEERFLTPRDAGPARRWVRDYIDARWNLGEIMIVCGMGLALLALMAGFIGAPRLTIVVSYLLYPLILVTAVDGFLLRRRVQRMTTERFGADRAAGTGTYAMLRALQIRRSRVPKPRVARGRFPS